MTDQELFQLKQEWLKLKVEWGLEKHI